MYSQLPWIWVVLHFLALGLILCLAALAIMEIAIPKLPENPTRIQRMRHRLWNYL